MDDDIKDVLDEGGLGEDDGLTDIDDKKKVNPLTDPLDEAESIDELAEEDEPELPFDDVDLT